MSDTEKNQSNCNRTEALNILHNAMAKVQGFSSLIILALSFLAGICILQLQADLAWVSKANIASNELIYFVVFSLTLFVVKPGWRVALAFIIGFVWALFHAQLYAQQRLPDGLAGQDMLIEGTVIGLPDYSERSVRFNFKVSQYISINGQNLIDDASLMPGRLRLSWYYQKNTVHSGERWRLKVRLKPPHGMINPGGFDYEKWLYQQSIHATGYIRKDDANQRVAPASFSFDVIRENLLVELSSLPDPTFEGLLQALTIGHKSSISTQQWQVLRETGTSHLMAISGLHIGLVAGMVFFLVRRLVPASVCRHISAPQVAAIFSIVAGGFYAMLAGFSVPTQRAFIMLLVFMLAILLKRPAFSLNTLSLALVAVLILDPLSVLAVGFWLSFIAVLTISFVTASRIGQPQSRLKRGLQAVKVQWLIALSMLPLSILLFQQGSLISPIANMLAIPLVGLIIVPLALLASFISVFSAQMSLWLFTQASWLLSFIWDLLLWLSHFPMASWQRSSLPYEISFLALSGALLLLMPKAVPMRYAGFILLLPLVFYATPKPVSGAFWVSVLDVGQGLAVVVQTHDKTLLYDAGAKFSERFDIGQRVVVPYLNYSGVQKLDYLLISHADNDHAGGGDAVLRMLDVESLLAETSVFNEKARAGQNDRACRAGQSWVWNQVTFEILHPDKHYTKSNNRSCVLKISNANSSLLLTGDIERVVETHLLKSFTKKLAANVLLVPHHGSNTSSSINWLRKVNPQLAIVSAGYKNRFSHPTTKTLERYRTLDSKVLNTANSGMIQLKFSANHEKPLIRVQQLRKVNTHYWNHRL